MTATTHIDALIQALCTLESMPLMTDTHDVLATEQIMSDYGTSYAACRFSEFYDDDVALKLSLLLCSIVELASDSLVTSDSYSVIPNASQKLLKAGFKVNTIKSSGKIGNVAVYIDTIYGPIFIAMHHETTTLIACADAWGYDDLADDIIEPEVAVFPDVTNSTSSNWLDRLFSKLFK